LCSCGEPSKQEHRFEKNAPTSSTNSSHHEAARNPETSTIVVMVFPNNGDDVFKSKSWGFDVFVDGKRFIHQPNVPLRDGVIGFETEAMAKMAGERMAEKIRKGIIPPSLDSTDLNAIGVEW
jgi:hypothetical protein